MAENDKRYHLIDGIRGATVISMVLYHFFYDFFVVYGGEPRWYAGPAVHFWQQTICWSFILISGFVWPWGRKKNLRRGVVLNLLGLGITVVTRLFMPEQTVRFGILSFLGCAVLLMYLLEKPARRLPPVPGLVLSFALFLLTLHINEGYIGFRALLSIDLPSALYEVKLLTPLGFPFRGFQSGDFFPILPWLLLYLTGYHLGRVFERCRELHGAARINIPVLSYVGRRTLWVYLLHQPLCVLACCIILRRPLF